MRNIGKPCVGEPQAWFDEGRLMIEQICWHAVAACGEASVPQHVLTSKRWGRHMVEGKVNETFKNQGEKTTILVVKREDLYEK
jgi:hypothetical protein